MGALAEESQLSTRIALAFVGGHEGNYVVMPEPSRQRFPPKHRPPNGAMIADEFAESTDTARGYSPAAQAE